MALKKSHTSGCSSTTSLRILRNSAAPGTKSGSMYCLMCASFSQFHSIRPTTPISWSFFSSASRSVQPEDLGNIPQASGGCAASCSGAMLTISSSSTLASPPVFRAALVQLFKAELIGDAVGHFLTGAYKDFLLFVTIWGNILLIKE